MLSHVKNYFQGVPLWNLHEKFDQQLEHFWMLPRAMPPNSGFKEAKPITQKAIDPLKTFF